MPGGGDACKLVSGEGVEGSPFRRCMIASQRESNCVPEVLEESPGMAAEDENHEEDTAIGLARREIGIRRNRKGKKPLRGREKWTPPADATRQHPLGRTLAR